METTDELTIEQFAQRVGMTVRNVREWQTLGLLRPPDKRGRVGVYGPAHVAQVERIQQLKADGFPLSLIRRMLEREPPATETAVRGLASAILEPFHDEEPVVLATTELRERLKIGARAPVTPLAEVGVVQELGDGRVRIRSPRVLRALEEAIENGLPLGLIVEPFGRIRQHHKAIAEILIDFYREHVWKPFLNAGMPTEDWPNITQLTRQLRPLLNDAVVGAFRLILDDAAEQAILEEATEVPPQLLHKYAPHRVNGES